MYQTLVFNLNAKKTRIDEMEGQQYLVVPVVMLTEGVHNGSHGPIYYPKDELAKFPAVWNAKPVVVYHPQFKNNGISACDPLIFTKQKVGLLMNTVFDGKLRSEVWLNVDKANQVDDRVMQSVESNKPMEVSTGLFMDEEATTGEWNGEEYTTIARNFRPDHLALLPDKVGACSLADGAGLLIANALSFSNVNSTLSGLVYEKYGDRSWVVDVYPDFFVFEVDGELKRSAYTNKDDVIAISADAPEIVKRVTEYRTVDGRFVGNSSARELLRPFSTEADMAKKDVVDGLITNKATQWEEKDREYLMKQDDATLAKFAPVANTEPKVEPPKEEPASAPVAPALAPVTPAAPVTMEAYISSAPPELRGVLSRAVQNDARRKTALVDKLFANKKNRFTKPALEGMELEVLQNMAAMTEEEATPERDPDADYFGQATPPGTVDNQATTEEALVMPVMNFGAEKK